MARKAMIEKEKKRAKMTELKYARRQELKQMISSQNISHEERLKAIDLLNQLPKNSSPIRKRNRCQFTGRCRGYLRKFQMSRICFREMANSGVIPGVFKASW